jgi:hypothetical protein
MNPWGIIGIGSYACFTVSFLCVFWGRGGRFRVLLWSLGWPVSLWSGWRIKRRYGQWPPPMRHRAYRSS